MEFFLIKFVRINGGINSYFVCWGNRVVQEQYVVITSDIVISCCGIILFLVVLLQKVLVWGEDSIASLCFWCYQGNEETR